MTIGHIWEYIAYMGNMADLSTALAARLKRLRQERDWTLDALASRTDVSRASLARIEAGQVSPTAETLNRICAAYGTTLSRLLASIEAPAEPLIPRAAQPFWTDPETGFERRGISPPAPWFQAEMIEGRLPAGAVIQYDRSPKPGIEHHLHLLEGALRLVNDGRAHDVAAGDTLRWKTYGATRFESLGPKAARYILTMI